MLIFFYRIFFFFLLNSVILYDDDFHIGQLNCFVTCFLNIYHFTSKYNYYIYLQKNYVIIYVIL